MDLLNVRNLSISAAGASRPLVRDVNLRLESGHCLGLVGESGSGKSLTALAIMQLLSVFGQYTSQGEIIFDGNNLANLSDAELCGVRGKHLALVFQQAATALNPIARISTQIAEALRTHQFAVGNEQEHAEYLLAELALENPKQCLRSFPFELSGGMRQRAMVAMALACNPKCLIADEPTTAVDTVTRAKVLSVLRDRCSKGMAMMFITHDLGLLPGLADTVAVMHRGRIVECAPTAELLSNPQQSYTRKLVGSMVSLQGRPKSHLTAHSVGGPYGK